MNEIFEYILKSGISLIIFYSVYHFIFKNDTSFKFNRLYLFSSILLSLMVPVFKLFETIAAEYTMKPINYLEKIIINNNSPNVETADLNFEKIIVLFYLSISTTFALKFLFQLVLILKLVLQNKITIHSGYKFVHIPDNTSPFSFLNIIFINQKAYSAEDYNKITAHEKIHVNQFHSIDIILIELVIILFWFNPIVWLYRKQIALNHEFLADSGVIEQGFEKSNYQMLILEQLFDNHSLNLVQNFNILLIKKRISMMEKYKKSSKYKKLAAILPVSLILIFFGAYNTNAQNLNSNKDVTICNDPDILPEFPGGLLALRKHLAVNIKIPKEAKGVKVKAEYTVHFIVDKKGKVDVIKVTKGVIKKEDEVVVMGYADQNIKPINKENLDVLFRKESKRVVSSLPDFKPGKKNGNTVKVLMQIPIVFVLNDNS